MYGQAKNYLFEYKDGHREYHCLRNTDEAVEYCRKHKCTCLNLYTAILY
jgi:hypothetical protein